ncbi:MULTISPECIES: hypothetical protein [Cedecea]|jgi:hypothetical protein|uniref:Uncharacterized protein n=1 Tax=Cedecea neteri TaxID=158822 RepID=A0A089Q5N2_9ENTR|nr:MULTISPECIES: hypothetical protein [Cedecea]AIR06601.1 hypothetical protein JT31_18890 [Cedecea neteri]NWC64767.1 hypothetical protein [Cedecea sp. P7760]
MKLTSLASLLILTTIPVTAAPGINFPYQKHYACTWLLTGTPQPAPDLYTAVNARSGAMTLQRAGSQVYYAKKIDNGIWQELNPEPNQAEEYIRVSPDGMLDTYQANIQMSTCIEVE